MIIVHFDGLCEPKNPGGVATYGYVVYVSGEKVHEGHGVVGEGKGMSNNVAEFTGLVAALEWLLENGYRDEKITVRGDSQLAINIMNGIWNAKGGLYYPYYLKARKLASNFNNIHFEWVPRERNEEADTLSRKAYEEYCKNKGMTVRYMKDEGGKKNRKATAIDSGTDNSYTGETCMTCRWVRFSGPHIGCYYGGEYRKWLSRKFARNSKCENYEPQ